MTLLTKSFAYLRLLRIPGWVKNFFVIAPLFFAKKTWDPLALSNTLCAFAAFCMTASTVYVMNDLIDSARDREHPTKKLRPIAAGLISKKTAVVLFVMLLCADALMFSFLSMGTVLLLLGYMLLNIFYTFSLKHIPVVDVIVVASFYVLRIMVGGSAAQVPVSNWLIMTTIFLSLLLVLGKRKSELSHEVRRPVLAHYGETFLNSMLAVSASLAIISYGLYILIVHNLPFAVFTILFVLMGVMRYLLLVYNGHNVESLERLIIKDPIIMASLGLWALSMYFIIYTDLLL